MRCVGSRERREREACSTTAKTVRLHPVLVPVPIDGSEPLRVARGTATTEGDNGDDDDDDDEDPLEEREDGREERGPGEATLGRRLLLRGERVSLPNNAEDKGKSRRTLLEEGGW